MKRSWFSIAAVSAALCAIPCAALAQGPMKVLNTIKAGTGRWDYVSVDPETHRLYLSNATQVIVLDGDKGTSVGTVADCPGIHGIALVPDLGLGVTSNGRSNTLSVFDLKSLKTIHTIKAGQNPDSIIYDPASKKIFAMNGRSGDVTMADPAAADGAPVQIPVGGKLETGVSDGAGHVFVNVEDKNEIVQIDSKAGKVLAHWSISPGTEPSGLSMDVKNHRLYAGCSNKMMVVVDSETGKVLATPAVGSGVDGSAFDPSHGLAFCPNGGDGTVSVIKEEPAGTFKVIQTLPTAKTARTITCDPKSGTVYLPAAINNVLSVVVVGQGG